MSQLTGKIERENHEEECKRRMHFVHDVKYVTISLNKDRQNILKDYKRDILSLQIGPIKERFANEYEYLMGLFHQELHKNDFFESPEMVVDTMDQLVQRFQRLRKSLDQWKEFQTLVEENFEIHGINSMETLLTLKQQLMNQRKAEELPEIWFNQGRYEEIKSFLDKIQTKAEEFIHARKRMLKVWKPQILEEEYDEILTYFQHMERTSFKFFNANFWRMRKQIRQLFLLEGSLLNEHEMKLLISNRAILKKNSLWMQMKKDKIYQYYGKINPLDLHSLDNMRKQYEDFYQIWCEYQSIDFEAGLHEIDELLPEIDFYERLQLPLTELSRYVSGKVEKCIHLKQDYSLFYELRRKPEEQFSFHELRKAMYLTERIQTKLNWLEEQSDAIAQIFGTTKISEKTAWEQYQRVEAVCEFPVYEYYLTEYHESQSIEQYLEEVVSREQPILEAQLLKKAATAMKQARVNPTVKSAYRSFLEKFRGQFEVTDDFVESVDKEKIQFRILAEGKRELSTVLDSELRDGIMKLLVYEEELTLEEITKRIAQLLGYPRRSTTMNTRIQKQVNQLKRQECIRRYSGGWRLQKHNSNQ